MIELENTCEIAAVSMSRMLLPLPLTGQMICVSILRFYLYPLKCSRDICVPCKDWMRAG